MLRGMIKNDPRSPRPITTASRRARKLRLLAALAGLLFVVLMLRDARFDGRLEHAKIRLEPATCDMKAATKGGAPRTRASRRIIDTDCASDTVDAGDCIQEAPGPWYARWSRGPPRHLRCLPSFVIAGAQKAATGSLSAWLEAHPALRRGVGASGHPGEVHYFDAFPRDASSEAVEATWRAYANRFPALSSREAEAGVQTFEKSPSYLRFDQAPRLLSGLLPAARWVVVLRDPVERAYSAFAHYVRHGRFGTMDGSVRSLERHACSSREFKVWRLAPETFVGECVDHITLLKGAEPATFDTYVRRETVAARDVTMARDRWDGEGPIDTVRDGDYAPQFEGLYAHVDPSRVHVVFFDDVLADPLGVVDDLQASLKLPFHAFAPRDVAASRRGWWRWAPPTRPPMAPETRTFLRTFFAPRLEHLLRVLRDRGGLDVELPGAWRGGGDARRPRRAYRVARPPARDGP